MTVGDVDPVPAQDRMPETDGDLSPGDELLGVSLRQVMQVRALRGVVLLVLAAAVLVWPGRTGRALGFLVAAALAAYAGTVAVELVRDRAGRRFAPIVGVGVALGLAAALVVHPEESLLTVTQVAAAIMLGLAAITLVLVVAGRHAVAWGIAKAVALMVGGGLLFAFPGALAVAATSILAGSLAAVALIDVFAPPEHESASVGPEPARSSRGVSEMAFSVTSWMRRRPSVAEDRAGLMDKIYFEGSDSAVRFARFVTLMVLASAIAALGVVAESTAVVIGAMLVAPLMTPLMGAAYSVTMGWIRRLRRSAGLALLGMGLSISVGALVGSVLEGSVDVTSNSEILARIAPTPIDLAIAVAAGAAGAFALTRRDVSDSLPGVAVAISLVPPLTVVGLCWQQGAWSAGNGALLLFLTNAVAILVAGGATFVLVGAAPLQRVSTGQERWATTIAVVASLAGVVLVLLLLNGSRIATTAVSRTDVDQIVQQWVEAHQPYRELKTTTLENGALVVDLAGPGTPPDLDDLLGQLQSEVGPDTKIVVTWTEQNSTSVGG